MLSTGYSYQILMKSEYSRQGFEKYSKKFMKIPSSGSRVVPGVRIDGRTWRSWQSAFRNSTNAPKNIKLLRGTKAKWQQLKEVFEQKSVLTEITLV